MANNKLPSFPPNLSDHIWPMPEQPLIEIDRIPRFDAELINTMVDIHFVSTGTTSAPKLLERLAALNFDEPYFNEQAVFEGLERYFAFLQVPMPRIQVEPNLELGIAASLHSILRHRDYESHRSDDSLPFPSMLPEGQAYTAHDQALNEHKKEFGRQINIPTETRPMRAALGPIWENALRQARERINVSVRISPENPKAHGLFETIATGLAHAEIKSPQLQLIELLLNLAENGLYYMMSMKDKFIVVPSPRVIHNDGRLHYDHGMAVSWADGTGFYFLRGVKFDEPLYNTIIKQEITAEEVMKIRDSDQRMAAISMLRPDRLLKQLKAKAVHTGQRGTVLYEVKNFMDTRRTEYCMHMKDASTDREFIEWVPPKIGKQKNADLAQANAWGIALEDYLNLSYEA